MRFCSLSRDLNRYRKQFFLIKITEKISKASFVWQRKEGERIDQTSMIFFCQQISSDANRTQFNRIRFLSKKYSLFVISNGSVSLEAGRNARKISVYPYKQKILRLFFPIWAIISIVKLLRANPELNRVYSTYEPRTLILSFLITKYFKLKWIADLWDDPEKFLMISKMSGKRFQFLNEIIKKIEFLLVKRVLKHADKIIIGLVSRDIINKYCISKSKVLSVTNGINLDYRFPSVPPVPLKVFTIFYCGTTDRIRLEGIRPCFRSIFKKIHRIRFVVAGPQIGDGYNWLIKQLKTLDRQVELDIKGTQPYENILNFISESDICICPYPDKLDLAAAYPVKIFDYMIMGKPVVASKLPGIEAVANHLEDAMLFEPGNYEEMAKNIIDLYTSGSLRCRISNNARRNVRKYGWQLIHEQISGFLDSADKKGRSSIQKR